MFEFCRYIAICRIIVPFMLFASCTSHGEFSILTLNIKRDIQSDKHNGWRYRKDLMASFLKENKPDIACFQEVLKSQLDDLYLILGHYDYIGCGRDDGRDKGEFTPIFFDPRRYDHLDDGTLWLSSTPKIPGSLGWDARTPRIATWVVLYDKDLKKRIVVINTHLDHIGKIARRNSVKLIQDSIINKFMMPTVVCGDFNCESDSKPYKDMTSGDVLFKDAFLVAEKMVGVGYTFHSYGKSSKRKRIDYTFISPDVIAKRIFIPEEIKIGNTFLSDHNPQMSILSIKN